MAIRPVHRGDGGGEFGAGGLAGLASAWGLARREWPGKAVVETLVSLPLVLPPVVTGLKVSQVHLIPREP